MKMSYDPTTNEFTLVCEEAEMLGLYETLVRAGRSANQAVLTIGLHNYMCVDALLAVAVVDRFMEARKLVTNFDSERTDDETGGIILKGWLVEFLTKQGTVIPNWIQEEI